ncbi:multidrug transporter MatE [Kiloniella spongiae]|uniref:Multidrug transporter MatE n=1 Tax=Kiloniella spongiae TaxID=1489064 RepID=A0A0H2MZT9_9PROT|nr:multidrug transporter MatE [Kiloniella spongiae]
MSSPSFQSVELLIKLPAHYKHILALATPLILSNLTVPLLGAVDTAVMGHLPDPAYIGGVAVGGTIFSFLFWGFGFLKMGTVGFTSQAFGAKNLPEQQAAFLRPMLLALLFGLILILLQAPLLQLCVTLIDGSAEVQQLAFQYSTIRIWSAPIALSNYVIIGWLIGKGEPKLTFILQVIINSVNIFLDLIFVLEFDWGVEGVSLATVIAESIGFAVGLWIILKKSDFFIKQIDWQNVWLRSHILALFTVNRDIFIRTLCLIFAFAYFTRLGAGMGDEILAANAVLMHFLYFSAYGLDGFAHAAEITTGHAKGRNDNKEFRNAVQASSVMALLTAAVFVILFYLSGQLIVNLFTDIPSVKSIATNFIYWPIIMPLISVASFQFDGIFIGTTRTADLRNAMIQSLIIFLISTWLLVPVWENHGLWLAMSIYMAARGITLLRYYPALARSIGSKSVEAKSVKT